MGRKYKMIYLDNAATTKPSSIALKKAEVFNEELYFNPSALYRVGLRCNKEIANAREAILKTLGAKGFEIFFNSGGTESDNTAIFSCVNRGCFVTDLGEHSAVYKSFLQLKNKGNNVEFVELNHDGSVNEKKLYDFVKNNRVDFVSIMHVNNETGAINDIAKIAKTLKQINSKIVFHSDGVQAYGKIPFVLTEDIDLYSISAHKINGLKGVGALIKRKGLNINPYLIGGGQENDKRSGTENLFGIKVFEFVATDHCQKIRENFRYVLSLKKRIINAINRSDVVFISGENSSPYILSISIKGLRGEVIMHALEEFDILVGNGSACSSKNRYSRVVEACGYDNTVLDGVLRISFSIENTIEEIDYFIQILGQTIDKLKGIMG